MSRLLLGVLSCLCVSGVGFAAEGGAKYPDTTRLYLEGEQLSATSAEQLEDRLKTKGDDFATRLKLACYYSGKRYLDKEMGGGFTRHAMWLIENAPDAPGIGNHVRMFAHTDGIDITKESGDLWLKQVDAYEGNVEVIANAADVFLLAERDRAEDLFRKAVSLERDNPRWPQRLGHLYSLDARPRGSTTAKQARKNAAKSLKSYERAMKLTEERRRRFLYEELANAAYDAGKKRKAAKYANLALDNASFAGQINGDAIYHGHTVLGLIAMDKGDTQSAKEHLIKSAQHDGSPVLGSFGPKLRLGKRLLDAGETEAVMEYIDLCAKFWRNDRGELDKWRALVEQERRQRAAPVKE